jgi:hypothetical protein
MDGAMWICDGRRLHRYDPATFTPTAVLDLDVDCGQVYVTDGLVVAWNYNDDPGQSGISAATFIDPSGDRIAGAPAGTAAGQPRVVATTPLPVDVGQPVVLADSVFFPAHEDASTAVVVDQGTWAVTATPDLGRPTWGVTTGYDGRSIYVGTADQKDVLVVDAQTFEHTDTIQTFGLNALVVDHGSVWVSKGDTDMLQRFDVRTH